MVLLSEGQGNCPECGIFIDLVRTYVEPLYIVGVNDRKDPADGV